MAQTSFLWLQQENIPCWYQLGFIGGLKPALVVKVHKGFSDFWRPLRNTPIVKGLIRNFGFKEFTDPDQKVGFGFEGLFVNAGMDGDFVTYQVKIPLFIDRISYKTCFLCYGDGQGLYGKCTNCNGKRKVKDSTYDDWHTMYAVSASFMVFFCLMGFGTSAAKAVDCLFPQLLLVSTMIKKGMHGAALDGSYSVPLARWLASLPEESSIDEVTEAMMQTHRRIFRKSKDFKDPRIGCRVRKNGWLNTGCYGDACGLHPSHSVEKGRGYEFSCHNVDSPMQQIILLAGLAALCDKARNEIKEW